MKGRIISGFFSINRAYPFTISPLLSFLFFLYSLFFCFLLGLSFLGSVYTKKERESARQRAARKEENEGERA
jgi:hypothetical protein